MFFNPEEQAYDCYCSMVANINDEEGWYSPVYVCDLQIAWSLRTIIFYGEKTQILISPHHDLQQIIQVFFWCREARGKWVLQPTKGEKMPSILGGGAGCDPGVLFLSGRTVEQVVVKDGICSFCLEPHIFLSQQRKTGRESWYLMWREITYSMKSVHFRCLHLT